jgi:hypothetical protein
MTAMKTTEPFNFAQDGRGEEKVIGEERSRHSLFLQQKVIPPRNKSEFKK